MYKTGKPFDAGSLIVIVVTFALFTLALFTKGFTHDILLEAAIFLVSVKLILMARKNQIIVDSLHDKLNQIYKKVDTTEPQQSKEK
jgi:hypothetical protein